MGKSYYYTEEFRNISEEKVSYLIEKLYITKNLRILDFWFWNWSFAKWLRKIFWNSIIIDGIEIDKETIKYASKRYNNIFLKNLENEEIEAKLTNVYDIIVALDVFEHILYPLNVISKLYKLLKKGWIIYIQVPWYNPKIIWDDYTHIRWFTRNSLERLLKDWGFSIKEVGYVWWIPFWWKLWLSEKLKEKILSLPILWKFFRTWYYIIWKK